MNYNWMKQVESFELLPWEYQEMIGLLGVEHFIRLLQSFEKSTVYFSERNLIPLLKDYIETREHIPNRLLARELRVSLRFVYKVKEESRVRRRRRTRGN